MTLAGALGDGALSTGERLARIERSIDGLAENVRLLAANADVRELSARVTVIERDYVPQASVKRYWVYISGQSFVILGLGLGFIYELLSHPPGH